MIDVEFSFGVTRLRKSWGGGYFRGEAHGEAAAAQLLHWVGGGDGRYQQSDPGLGALDSDARVCARVRSSFSRRGVCVWWARVVVRCAVLTPA